MNICIVGGDYSAEFVVSMFLSKHHNLTVINNDEEIAKYISDMTALPVIIGDPTKIYVYEDANIVGFDLLISLCDSDDDNYMICLIAKLLLKIKKTICIVKNPNNVDLFRRLGIDNPICSTYLLTSTIMNASNIESLVQTLSLENDKIVISEIKIRNKFAIIGKKLKEINFPNECTVCSIFRDPNVIIPNGESIIELNDKVIVLTTPDNQDNIVDFIKRTA